MKSVLLALTLAGCACEGELTVVAGQTRVGPGESVQFAYHYEGRTVASPTRCVAHWTVNDIEGGTPALGTIDACGTYIAPAVIAEARTVTIVGSSEGPGCADCCPFGARRVRLRPP